MVYLSSDSARYEMKELADEHEEGKQRNGTREEEQNKSGISEKGPVGRAGSELSAVNARAETATAHQSTILLFSSPSLLFHGNFGLRLFNSQLQGRLIARKMIPRMRKAHGTP